MQVKGTHSFWLLFDTMVKMYYVYILKSQKFEKHKLYIGSTPDLRRRFKEHNSGQSEYTKYGIPWKLVYYEAFEAKHDALVREKHLKTGTGAIGFLKRRIKQSLDSN